MGGDDRQAGNIQGAIEAWTQALSIDTTNTHAYYDRGITKAEMGDYTGAIEDLDQVIRLNPKYFNAYRQREIIYQKLLTNNQELKTVHKENGSNPILTNQTINKSENRQRYNFYNEYNSDYEGEVDEEYNQEINDEYKNLFLEGEEYTESVIKARDGWFYSDEDYDGYESFIRWNG